MVPELEHCGNIIKWMGSCLVVSFKDTSIWVSCPFYVVLMSDNGTIANRVKINNSHYSSYISSFSIGLMLNAEVGLDL